MITTSQAQALNRLFDGYLIMLQHAGYELDEQVTMIENLSDEEDEPDWQIETETRQLNMFDVLALSLTEVKVYARVDWANLINPEVYDKPVNVNMFGTDAPVSLQDWNQDLDAVYEAED